MNCELIKIRAYPRLLWVILLAVSAMGMSDIPSADILDSPLPVWTRWAGVWLASAFKASACVAALAVSRDHRVLHAAAVAVVAVYCFLCSVNFLCLDFYGFGISHKMLMLISATNAQETWEFLGDFFRKAAGAVSVATAFWLAGAAAICFLAYRIKPRVFVPAAGIASVAGLAALAYMVADSNYGRNTYFIIFRTAKAFAEVWRENREINALMDKMEPYGDAGKVRSGRMAFDLVVVYGESADTRHMSAYGYPLPTTPVLDAMADSIAIFRDAVASSRYTADNMERMLTMKRDCDSQPWWQYTNIIDILKAAGYRTCWLSNQERTGLWSNATSVLASRADNVRYVGKSSSEDHLLQKYDEVLLPYLENALADTVHPKWIGVHLYGSHVAYRNRYPDDRQHFSGSDIQKRVPRPGMDSRKYATVAEYDNSIRYTDSIVGMMIRMMSRRKTPGVLVYVSDHGENVYDDGDYCGRDIRNVRVPLLVYANAAYRSEHPDMAAAILRAVDKSVSTADLPAALLSLTGTTCPDYRPQSDFFSPSYTTRRRYVEDEPWPYDVEVRR